MRVQGRGGIRGSPRGVGWVVLVALGLGAAGWVLAVVATWMT
jgi:hypothetical protein